jgi:segregation and condensation protein A
MREAADWLAARPQLGQRVFAHGQGMPTPPRPQAELLVAFLEATLAMLEGREGQTTEAPPPYRPALPDLWRIPGALRRLAELLQQHPTGLPLERCLPPIPRHAPDRPLRFGRPWPAPSSRGSKWNAMESC